jgi:cell division protein FtsA
MVEVPGMGGRRSRSLPRQILAEILEPRMEEIYSLIKREIYRAGMENFITSGVVITGGSSMLEGAIETAESVFSLPTRIGRPMGISGLVDVVNNPMYATAVGLVLYGARTMPEKKFRIRDNNIFNRIITRMKKWFKDVI